MIKTRTIHRLVKKLKCRLESSQIKKPDYPIYPKSKEYTSSMKLKLEKEENVLRVLPLKPAGRLLESTALAVFPLHTFPSQRYSSGPK